MFFQYPNKCDTWSSKKPYDICIYVDLWNAFCGVPKGRVVPYRIWVDGVQKDNLADLNRQNVVQIESPQENPSTNGLVVYGVSHPVFITTPGPHTVKINYADQSVTFGINGITSLLDGYGNPVQCPRFKVQ
jgi:hypothetical protein